jgi:hypothetical protein
MKIKNNKQIYLPGLKKEIKNIEKKDYIKKEIITKLLLTCDGSVEIKNNNYLKKELIINDSYEMNEYIDNFEKVYINDITEKSEIINTIPFNHNYLEIKKIYYKLNKKSIVELVIEKIENEIKDIYFNINYNERMEKKNEKIKEEIVSFLLNLK